MVNSTSSLLINYLSLVFLLNSEYFSNNKLYEDLKKSTYFNNTEFKKNAAIFFLKIP